MKARRTLPRMFRIVSRTLGAEDAVVRRSILAIALLIGAVALAVAPLGVARDNGRGKGKPKDPPPAETQPPPAETQPPPAETEPPPPETEPPPPEPSPPPPEHTEHTVDPLGCTGYPERRVFLESQSWWQTTPGQSGTDWGHVHSATCFPWAQRISGTVTLDVRVVMHMNPGVLRHVQIMIATDNGSTIAGRVSPNIPCELVTCTFWYRVPVDTTVSPYDGRQEVRIQTHVDEPDGKRMFATTGWQAYLANGKPVLDYRASDNFTEGRGWYTEAEYTNASLRSALPTAPVSGTWTASVVLDHGTPGPPVTSHSIHIDPNFHAGHPGVVLQSAAGPFRGTLSIDTTRFANGPHRLVLKANSALSNGSTLTGIQVIPFVVAN